MDAVTVDHARGRRAWLERAEADLSERLAQRFAPGSGVWHLNDPLYQRTWYALQRVRSELSRFDRAAGARAEHTA